MFFLRWGWDLVFLKALKAASGFFLFLSEESLLLKGFVKPVLWLSCFNRVYWAQFSDDFQTCAWVVPYKKTNILFSRKPIRVFWSWGFGLSLSAVVLVSCSRALQRLKWILFTVSWLRRSGSAWKSAGTVTPKLQSSWRWRRCWIGPKPCSTRRQSLVQIGWASKKTWVCTRNQTQPIFSRIQTVAYRYDLDMFVVPGCSGGPGGKGALQQTLQEELPPSHTDAGEPDENGERWARGHAGSSSGAEERLASLTAESRGA